MARAVIFDLGGVVFPSPFEAFDAYDLEAALPAGSVRSLDPHEQRGGAWAALERGELTLPEFYAALEAEARAAGFELDAEALMSRVAKGFAAPAGMVVAIRRIRAAGLRAGVLTNNWPRATARSSRPPATVWGSTS